MDAPRTSWSRPGSVLFGQAADPRGCSPGFSQPRLASQRERSRAGCTARQMEELRRARVGRRRERGETGRKRSPGGGRISRAHRVAAAGDAAGMDGSVGHQLWVMLELKNQAASGCTHPQASSCCFSLAQKCLCRYPPAQQPHFHRSIPPGPSSHPRSLQGPSVGAAPSPWGRASPAAFEAIPIPRIPGAQRH